MDRQEAYGRTRDKGMSTGVQRMKRSKIHLISTEMRYVFGSGVGVGVRDGSRSEG